MNKTEEILLMLEHLVSIPGTIYAKYSNGVFKNLDFLIKITDKEYNDRDYSSLTVDFNNKTITWHAWNESHHNGSSYNNVEGSADWFLLEESFDNFKSETLRYLKQEVLEEESFYKEKIQNFKAQHKLDVLLNKI